MFCFCLYLFILLELEDLFQNVILSSFISQKFVKVTCKTLPEKTDPPPPPVNVAVFIYMVGEMCEYFLAQLDVCKKSSHICSMYES